MSFLHVCVCVCFEFSRAGIQGLLLPSFLDSVCCSSLFEMQKTALARPLGSMMMMFAVDDDEIAWKLRFVSKSSSSSSQFTPPATWVKACYISRDPGLKCFKSSCSDAHDGSCVVVRDVFVVGCDVKGLWLWLRRPKQGLILHLRPGKRRRR